MADTCKKCYMVLGVAQTTPPSNQFTTRLTGLSWGYNRNMAKTGDLGFPLVSTDTAKKPLFEPFTPEQEKAFLEEVKSFDFLFGNDFGLWGDDETTKKDSL